MVVRRLLQAAVKRARTALARMGELLDADTRLFGAVVAFASLLSGGLIVLVLMTTHELCARGVIKFC